MIELRYILRQTCSGLRVYSPSIFLYITTYQELKDTVRYSDRAMLGVVRV